VHRADKVVVFKYENVSHRVAATITIVSVKESGCLRVDLVRRFDRREVSESRRRCLKKKQWERLDRAVDAAKVFTLAGGYPCKPPGEGESKQRTKAGGVSERSADGFSQSLTVRIGGRKKSIAPICVGPNATAPKALLDLVSLIKEVGLR
jgi:hypothetical protein